MAPFHGWGSHASRLHPLRGGSLLFTTKVPDIPGLIPKMFVPCRRDRSSRPKVFCKKKVFLKISQNSPENICARVSFLIKLRIGALQLY